MTDLRNNLVKLAAAAMCIAAAANLHADTVTLKRSAAVGGEVVRLADIAMLDGDDAAALADVQVAALTASQQNVTVKLADVRRSLDERKVNWGKLTLRGALAVTVSRAEATERRSDEATKGAEAPVIGEVVANHDGVIEVPVQKGINSAATLRDQIAGFIIVRVNSDAKDVKITFEDEADARLTAAITADVRHEIEAPAGNLVGRVTLTVRGYRGGQIVSTERFRVHVQVRRPVVLVRRALSRGQTITDGDVEPGDAWFDSLLKEPVGEAAKVIGQRAAGVMRSGSMIYAGDVRPADLVQRGQVVTVRCVSGGLVIKTVARAMADGIEGEIIAVRNERTREVYDVRVTGPQEAMLIVGEAAETQTLASTEEK